MVPNSEQALAIGPEVSGAGFDARRFARALLGYLMPVESRHPRVWELLGAEKGRAQITTLRERSIDVTADMDLVVKSVEPEHSYQNLADLTGRTRREAFRVTSRPALIHPAGWITTQPWRLDERSLIDYNLRPRPGLRRTLALRAAAPRSPRLQTAVSLRTFGETNYYHALHDVIGGPMRLADENGVGSDVPLVISEHLAATPFFRDLLKFPGLADRNWFTQRIHSFVKVDNLYFAETARFAREPADYLRTLLAIPDSNRDSSDRIFITRDPAIGRSLTNYDEISVICKRYGFRMIDPGTRTLAEQIETFSHAGYVASIHGAGLYNIIFRKNAPLQVLEIFPNLPVEPAFFFLCRFYGFDYHAIIGNSPLPWVQPHRNPFWLNPDVLVARLEDMLEADPSPRMTA